MGTIAAPVQEQQGRTVMTATASTIEWFSADHQRGHAIGFAQAEAIIKGAAERLSSLAPLASPPTYIGTRHATPKAAAVAAQGRR